MGDTTYLPFPQTHWSMVQRVGVGGVEARQEALGVLLERYLPALRSYLRVVRKMQGADADDLLQAFVSDKVLRDSLLLQADATRGRFRTFLLTSLNRFAIDGWRRLRREREAAGGSAEHAEGNGEEWADAEGSADGAGRVVEARGDSAAAVFDVEWSRALLRQVTEAMREACEREGKHGAWRVFESRVLGPAFGAEEAVGYEQLAAELKLESVTQAGNLLVTAKRMYARMLRQAIGEYVKEEEEIEAELAELHAVLARGR